MTMQDQLGKTGAAFKKYAPEILTGASVLGLGATVYFTGRASFKAGILVATETTERIAAVDEDAEVNYMTPREIIKETWKFYIPAITIGLVTCTAIVGSNSISRNRQVAMISAAAIAEQSYREYKDKIIETTSKGKEQKVKDAVIQDSVDEKSSEIERLPILKDGDVWVIESHTKQVFVSNAEKIHRAENDANREAIHDGYVSLNTFLDYLGLPTSDAGDVVGWTRDKPLEVRLGAAARDEKPVLTIDYVRPPTVDYLKPW